MLRLAALVQRELPMLSREAVYDAIGFLDANERAECLAALEARGR